VLSANCLRTHFPSLPASWGTISPLLLFGSGHPRGREVFAFAFSSWPVMVSTFSYVHWPSVCLLEINICHSDSLPIFRLD
jgi:hypothetical protein